MTEFMQAQSKKCLVVLAMVAVTLLLMTVQAATDKPNIVFLLSDNQSYYEMSCHGYTQVQTPHIDRLAEQGIDFQRFYAPPYCSPSRSVMMTGIYALRSGIHNTIGGRSIMHKKDRTIADILKDNGYATAIFGKWHLGTTYPHRPEDRGFDEVFVHGGGGIGQLEDYFGNRHYDPTFTHNDNIVHTKGYSTDILFSQAMEWIQKKKKQPFFCFVSTPAMHVPHHGPKDANGKNTGLNGMIKNFDENVGRMMNKLDDLGLSDNTVLVYASDQGMFDRGSPEGQVEKTKPWHDSTHHVPFMVRLPGGKSGINTDLTGMIDFVPTMLDLCSIDIPGNMDGISLKPLLMGDDDTYPKNRTMIIQCPRERNARKWKNVSVKMGHWRLTSGKKLFDIETDPRQENDVAANHPEMVEQLSQVYEDFWSSLPDPSETLSHHLLGTSEAPEVTLNAMDWYQGAQPWELSAIKANPVKRKNQNGVWPVTIAESGTYRFELRRFPREADEPIGLTRAAIQIGDVGDEQEISDAASFAVFELELQAGEYDLKTRMDNGADSSMNYGALFVYVLRK